MANAKRIHQMTIEEWEAVFPDEDACCAYLVAQRWPKKVACLRCGNVKVKAHGTMPWHWLCNECSPSGTNYRFSHITGTVFENTNKSLRDWFRVLHALVTSKKGVSFLQIHRTLGYGSYKAAWYMCHRLHAALQNEDFLKLMGIVGADETFVGGKRHNTHRNDRDKGLTGASITALAILIPVSAFGAPLRPEEASRHIGQSATVCGRVASARYAATVRGQPTFLDLGQAYPNTSFMAIIWGESRAAFGDPERQLLGKRVCVAGSIQSYGGKPEITLQSASQLRHE